MNPFITIVYNQQNMCNLLVIYDEENIYYSEVKPYGYLRHFKSPHHIEINENLILHSRNNKNLMVLNKK